MSEECVQPKTHRLDEAMGFIRQDIAELYQRYEVASEDDKIAIDHDREVYEYILCVLQARVVTL